MPADLGILIVTLKRRRPYLARLMRRLAPQLSSRVEIFTLEDEGAETIGRKRQRMLEETPATPFCCFIDDDDLVADTYCADVLAAIDAGAEVVGFRTTYYENDRLRGYGVLSKDPRHNPYLGWRTVRVRKQTMPTHYRTPNHLSPVRREMALAAGFPDKMCGEDAAFSRELHAKFPQMKEVFIDKVEYEYLYRGDPRRRVEGEHIPVPDLVPA